MVVAYVSAEAEVTVEWGVTGASGAGRAVGIGPVMIREARTGETLAAEVAGEDLEAVGCVLATGDDQRASALCHNRCAPRRR